ncbi:MAG: magnesium/cobalt transporter CorA [Candidatus Marinimicrobia bacterium]|nr:magnesium/cobalt transporter CorA [Candidatus Neomarinimicrobiota bacterium]
MARFLKKKHVPAGNIPGEPVFIGEKRTDVTEMHVIDYDAEHVGEARPDNIDALFKYRKTDSVTWININGVHDTERIRTIAEGFGVHVLITEDIVNTDQRPKMEEYDDHLFFVAKMISYDKELKRIHAEQLSMVLGNNFLITFQERPGDVFETVRERIRRKRGRIRECGADYLAYVLMDTVIDNYLFLMEHLGEQIEDLEEVLLGNPDKNTLGAINDFKHEMNYLRKSIRPAKEFILHLSRLDSDLIQTKTRPFLKDLLDIATQALEAVDTYRTMLTDHLEIYKSNVSNRLNEIMKVLTIFSAIFIPLTFIAGVYGANFVYMPELNWPYAYPVFWGVLITVALVMLRFFKRKKWL